MRNLGNKCYSIDIDLLWYKFSPSPIPIAAFEWKHFNQRYLNKGMVAAQIGVAEAMGIPLFIGITFTKNEDLEAELNQKIAHLELGPVSYSAELVIDDDPIVFLIPGNKKAEDALDHFEGRWFREPDLINLNAVCSRQNGLYEALEKKPTSEPEPWQQNVLEAIAFEGF